MNTETHTWYRWMWKWIWGAVSGGRCFYQLILLHLLLRIHFHPCIWNLFKNIYVKTALANMYTCMRSTLLSSTLMYKNEIVSRTLWNTHPEVKKLCFKAIWRGIDKVTVKVDCIVVFVCASVFFSYFGTVNISVTMILSWMFQICNKLPIVHENFFSKYIDGFFIQNLS